MKHAARVMTPRKKGSILSIASTAGVMGGLGPHAYTAAKHGVVGLTKSVASELAQHGIRVNAVAPGNTVTAMTASLIAGDAADHDATAQRIASGARSASPPPPRIRPMACCTWPATRPVMSPATPW